MGRIDQEQINKDRINQKRILREFEHLVSFDSESFYEKRIADYLKKRLIELGLSVSEDDAGKNFAKKGYEESASNIYGKLKGNTPGDAYFFSSHMDTVSPGKGKKAVLQKDGTITSDKSTVLGADDVSGITAILEALQVIKEKNLSHPDIEVIFTVAEEPYCEGSRYLDYSKIEAQMGYVLDLVGPVGTAAISAPSILSLKVEIKGKASHAGFAPEAGINALTIAVNALAKIKTGRVDERTTINFGTIQGGNGKNIVPEYIAIEGEIRSFSHNKAISESEKIREIFEKEAIRLGGNIEFSVTEHIRAYEISENEKVVEHFNKSAGGIPRCITPKCIKTYGGSDANRFNENGKKVIVLACAMENCHSTNEHTSVKELENAAELTLELMTAH